jgi:DNA-binding response OmpR family regulator
MTQPAAKVDNGPRVLVAEDNYLIGDTIRLILQDLGCEVVGPFARLEEVLSAIQIDTFDGALLDLDLNGESILPAASELDARGIPFIVATGREKSARLPELLAQAPFLTKPFQVPELERLVLKNFPLQHGA